MPAAGCALPFNPARPIPFKGSFSGDARKGDV
jgi:hypothetical protein